MSTVWKSNCAQLVAFDETLATKDSKIGCLTQMFAELEAIVASYEDGHSSDAVTTGREKTYTAVVLIPSATRGNQLRGKAPPVLTFSGENLEMQLEDWLPALDRARVWNAWTLEEKMMQLAGHLTGRAL